MNSLSRRLFIITTMIMFLGTVASLSAQQPETAVFGIPYSIDTLDPHPYTDALSPLHFICDGLLGYDTSTGLFPLLVDEIPSLENGGISDDGMTYTFDLYEGIIFSDGTPLIAQDVVFSLRRAELPELEDITAVDDQTVQLTLTRPVPSLIARLPGYFIVSEANAESIVTNPICTGSYVVADWIPGERLNLEVNPNFWWNSPVFEGLSLPIIPDLATRRSAFESGELDFALILGSEMPAVADLSQIKLTSGLLTELLALNLNDPITGDIRVRQALALAIDQQVIADIVFQGRVQLGAGFYSADMRGNNFIELEYDPERAMELLYEAGYELDADGVFFTLQALTRSSSIRQDVLAVIQDQLASIGINLQINTVEFSAWSQELSQCNFQIAPLSWFIDYGNLDELREFYNFFASCGYTDIGSYGVLEEASSIFDLASQTQLYYEAERIAATQDFTFVSLYHYNVGTLFNRELRSSLYYYCCISRRNGPH